MLCLINDKRTHKKNKGFTLIELVVVIVLMGILVATSMPKFIDVAKEARRAAIQGAAGSLGAGVNLVQGTWVARGGVALGGTSVTLADGITINVTTNGWPSDSNAKDSTGSVGSNTNHSSTPPDDDTCKFIWYGLVQNSSVVVSGALTAKAAFGATHSGTNCVYQDVDLNTITYDLSTGTVTTS